MKSLKAILPTALRTWLNRRRRNFERKLIVFDRVRDWSALRSTRPYRADLGGRRGQCVDRFYIEKFLSTYQDSVRGVVGEIEGSEYTRKFGADRVVQSEIIDINEENLRKTMTLDLTQTLSAPVEMFDCVICTQTLLFIADYEAAIQSLHKMLRPGGVALVTVPGISPTIRGSLIGGKGEDFWRFTSNSIRYVFGKWFGEEDLVVHTYGNVLTATAFLHGLVQEELTLEEMEYNDPGYEVIIGVKVTRRFDG